MNTKMITVNPVKPDVKKIEEAGRIIKQGGLVGFPTETVYGLGGDALNPRSSCKIYEAKGRPSDNPLIVHICKWEDLSPIVKEIPREAVALAEAFWPGPLTMIFHKSDLVPKETTGGLETVAVRMPSHLTALKFIEMAGGYVAAPSANRSGRPSPTLAKYVSEDMDGRIEMIIDGGEVGIGIESTIIDLTEKTPTILRPGYITEQMLRDILGKVETDMTILSDSTGQAPKAPGMKYRHYAPKGDLTIVDGEEEQVIPFINEQTEKLTGQGKRVGVIATDKTKGKYLGDNVKCAGDREEESTIAKQLYKILREFDDEEVEFIYSESFNSSGIGQAIMNRLLKAAGHHLIKLK